jgi:protein-tyrosine phosphatase
LSEGRARADNPKKVLFVCTANVCRSPMAEAIFDALAEERGLAWRAESAGVAALVDEDITPNAHAALEEVGIYAPTHRARQVDEAMLGEADLVLGMGPRHVATLRRRFGDLSERVYTLPEYALGAPPEEGIPDPYGQTMTAFRASVRQLLEHIEGLVKRLEREGRSGERHSRVH